MNSRPTAFNNHHPVHPILAKVFSDERRNAALGMIHSGWLTEYDIHNRSHKRYVALREDDYLYLYDKDITNAVTCKPLGRVAMHQVHRIYTQVVKRKRWSLIIECRREQSYTFRSKSEECVKTWLEVLHTCQRKCGMVAQAYYDKSHVRARHAGALGLHEPMSSEDDEDYGYGDETATTHQFQRPEFLLQDDSQPTRSRGISSPVSAEQATNNSHIVRQSARSRPKIHRIRSRSLGPFVIGDKKGGDNRRSRRRDKSPSSCDNSREYMRSIALKHILGYPTAPSGDDYGRRGRKSLQYGVEPSVQSSGSTTTTTSSERSELSVSSSSSRKSLSFSSSSSSASASQASQSKDAASDEKQVIAAVADVPPKLPPKLPSRSIEKKKSSRNLSPPPRSSLNHTPPVAKSRPSGARRVPPPLPPKRHSVSVSSSGDFTITPLEKEKEKETEREDILTEFPAAAATATSPDFEPTLPIITEPPPAELPPPHYLPFPGAPKPKKQRKHTRSVSDGQFAFGSLNVTSLSRRAVAKSEAIGNRGRKGGVIKQDPMLTEQEVANFRTKLAEFQSNIGQDQSRGDKSRTTFYEKQINVIQAKLGAHEERVRNGEVPFEGQGVQEGIAKLTKMFDDLLEKGQQQKSLAIWDLLSKLKGTKVRFDSAATIEEKKKINNDVKLYLSSISSHEVVKEIKRLNDILEWANSTGNTNVSLKTWTCLKKIEVCNAKILHVESEEEKQREMMKLSELLAESSKCTRNGLHD